MTDPIFTFTDSTGDTLSVEEYTSHTRGPCLNFFVPTEPGSRVSEVFLPRDQVVALDTALTGWMDPARTDLRAQAVADLETERDEAILERNKAISERDRALENLDRAEALASQRQAKINDMKSTQVELFNQRDYLQDHLDTAGDKIDTLTEQLSDAKTVPTLPPEMGQRLFALTASRDVALNEAKGSVFTKGGRTVAQADVLSLAHFIVSGDRDYVTHDGEYVERAVDNWDEPTFSQLQDAARKLGMKIDVEIQGEEEVDHG